MPSQLYTEPSSSSNPLRIGFDVSSATSRRPRGIASYIRALLPALESAAPWIEPVLFLRDERWFRKSAIADLLPGAERRWLLEPIKGRLGDLDVFHGLGTRLPRSARLPRSFTLHDLRGFDIGVGYDPRSGPRGNKRKRDTVGRADGIISLTEYGRDRMLEHFPELNREEIHVIGHGVDFERFHPREAQEQQVMLKRFGLNGPFFLQLGSFFPHKNLELSLKGFARSRALKEGYQLLFVGGGGSDVHRAKLRELALSLGLTGQIAWIDDLSPSALPITLSAARGLLMPSRYEGFGLPILEAMASGVPGICSDSSCLPEVADGIWDTCDPDDDAAFAEALDLLVFDDSEHSKKSAAGLERAQEFTWERCAERTARFLNLVAKEATVSKHDPLLPAR